MAFSTNNALLKGILSLSVLCLCVGVSAIFSASSIQTAAGSYYNASMGIVTNFISTASTPFGEMFVPNLRIFLCVFGYAAEAYFCVLVLLAAAACCREYYRLEFFQRHGFEGQAYGVLPISFSDLGCFLFWFQVIFAAWAGPKCLSLWRNYDDFVAVVLTPTGNSIVDGISVLVVVAIGIVLVVAIFKSVGYLAKSLYHHSARRGSTKLSTSHVMIMICLVNVACICVLLTGHKVIPYATPVRDSFVSLFDDSVECLFQAFCNVVCPLANGLVWTQLHSIFAMGVVYLVCLGKMLWNGFCTVYRFHSYHKQVRNCVGSGDYPYWVPRVQIMPTVHDFVFYYLLGAIGASAAAYEFFLMYSVYSEFTVTVLAPAGDTLLRGLSVFLVGAAGVVLPVAFLKAIAVVAKATAGMVEAVHRIPESMEAWDGKSRSMTCETLTL